MHLCRVDLAAADNTAVWGIEDQCAVDRIEFTERKELWVDGGLEPLACVQLKLQARRGKAHLHLEVGFACAI